MLHQTLEVRGDGEEITLRNTYDTDPYEEAAHDRKRDNGKGFIFKKNGEVWGRMSLDIPLIDMMALEMQNDLDWLEYDRGNSRTALLRLLARFPHWKICDGSL
jgi:hypothetical protein